MVGLIFKIPPTYFHFSNPGSFLGHSLFSAALLITTIATFISCAFAFMLGILLDTFNLLSYIMLTTLQDEHCYLNFTNREPWSEGLKVLPTAMLLVIRGAGTVAQIILLSRLGSSFHGTCQCRLLPCPRRGTPFPLWCYHPWKALLTPLPQFSKQQPWFLIFLKSSVHQGTLL